MTTGARSVRALAALALLAVGTVRAESVPVGRLVRVEYGVDRAHPYPMTGHDAGRSGRSRAEAPRDPPVRGPVVQLAGARLVPPVVMAGGLRVLGSEAGLSAYDRSGRLIWERRLGPVEQSPAVMPNGRLFVVAGSAAHLVDRHGRVQRFDTRFTPVGLPLVLDDGTLVTAGGDGALHALDPEGAEIVSVPASLSPLTRTAAVAGGWVIAADLHPRVVLLSMATGEVREIALSSGILAGPVAGGRETFWVVDRGGRLLQYGTDGRERTRVDLGGRVGRVALSRGRDGALRVAAGNEVRSIGEDGRERWRLTTDGQPGPITLDAHDAAVFATSRGTLQVVEAGGEIRYRVPAEAPRAPRVVIDADGTLLIVDRRGRLTAWR